VDIDAHSGEVTIPRAVVDSHARVHYLEVGTVDVSTASSQHL
jgi:hypothetical protein